MELITRDEQGMEISANFERLVLGCINVISAIKYSLFRICEVYKIYTLLLRSGLER